MSDKLTFTKHILSLGNIAILLFAILGPLFTLQFSTWEYTNPDYIDWDNPEWVRWAFLFAPIAIFIVKIIASLDHWKKIKPSDDN